MAVVVLTLFGGGLASSSCLVPRTTDEPDNACVSCHGSADRSTTALLQAAPPYDLAGHTSSTFPGVGAHQLHLRPLSDHAAVGCDECHQVPAGTETPGHTDTAAPAEFIPGPLARQGDGTPVYDPATGTCAGTYCHMDADEGSGSAGPPVWTAPRLAICGSCHGLPPPGPGGTHPQVATCHLCHPHVNDDFTFNDPTLHVNGVVDVVAH